VVEVMVEVYYTFVNCFAALAMAWWRQKVIDRLDTKENA
jgi:hypothetical protein